jgi:hypothetical protein
MPAQKRLWRHDQAAAALLRQDSRQRGKEGAIGRPQRRAPLLPLEYDQLMSQDEQLDVFGEPASAAADQQAQHSGEGEIGERKEHAAMLPPPATERSKSNNAAQLLDRQLLSCEARRDLVLARAREPPRHAKPPPRRTEPAF